MMDAEIFGTNPGGHHIINLLIHLCNGLLLFIVLREFTGKKWQSGFVAALFLLHPLHVESVAWISERKDVLSAFFWILSMWAYGRYARSASFLPYLALLIFFMLGLMAKPMVVTLPFVLLLLDFWPLNRYGVLTFHKIKDLACSKPFLRLLSEKIPLFVLSSVSSVITYLVQKHAGAVLSDETIPLLTRLAHSMVAYSKYLYKAFWPAQLSIFYPFPKTLSAGTVIFSILILAGLTFLALTKWRRFPYLLVGWLWFLGTLVPVIGLVRVGTQSMADRYTYIPLIGIFVMLTWGTSWLLDRWCNRWVVKPVLSALVLIPLMFCTWQYVVVWKDSISLFTHAEKATGNNYIAQRVLGFALAKQGKIDEAIARYQKALQIKPDYARAHVDLAIALTQKDDVTGAIHHYNIALKLNPLQDKAHYNLARIYDRQGDVEKAIYHYGKTIEADPGMTIGLYNLSWLLATHGGEGFRNGPEALKLADNLVQLTGGRQPLAFDALAAAYAEDGQFDRAVTEVKKGLVLASQYGPPELYTDMKNRLHLYENAQPYRQVN